MKPHLKPITDAIRRGVPLAAIITEYKDDQKPDLVDLSSIAPKELHLFDGCALFIPTAIASYLAGGKISDEEYAAAEAAIAKHHNITPATGFCVALDEDADHTFHASLIKIHDA